MRLIGHRFEILHNTELSTLFADFLTAYDAEQGARYQQLIVPGAPQPPELWRPIEIAILARWPALKEAAKQVVLEIETAQVKDVHGVIVTAHVTDLVVTKNMIVAYGQPFNLRSTAYPIDKLPLFVSFPVPELKDGGQPQPRL